MRFRRTMVSAFAVVATLVASAGHSGAMVLCVGLDGHIEVEASIDGMCASAGSHHEGEDTGDAPVSMQSPGGESDHCGSCVDLPLRSGAEDTGHPVLLRERTDAPTPHVVAALPNELRSAFDPIPIAKAPENSRSRDWASSLIPLKSVVLVL